MVTLKVKTVEMSSLSYEIAFTHRLPIVIEHMLRRPDLHAAVGGEEGPRTTLEVAKHC